MRRLNLWLWLAIPALVLLAVPSYWYFTDRLFRTLVETHNEGWVAYFADRAFNGLGLYPLAPALIQNNYPPVAFYLIGGLGKLLGNTILAGRIWSLIALVVMAGGIFLLVPRRGRDVSAGAFGAVFFLAFFAVYPGGRIGLNDPELLAHAIMTVGLVLLSRNGDTLRGAIAAACVMALAGLAKHNLIAVPMGVMLWALTSGRIVLLRWAVAMGIAGVLAVVLLWLGWGHAAFSSILVSRQMLPMQGLMNSRAWIADASIPLFVVAAAWIGRGWAGKDALPFWVSLAALVELLAFSAGAGVNSNVAYDLIFALSWAVGLICARAPDWRAGPIIAGGMILHLALTMPMLPLRVMMGQDASKAAEEKQVRADLAWLAGYPGRVMCGDLVICYYAGRAFEFDRFNMSQQFRNGSRNPDEILSLIKAHSFAVIELNRGDSAEKGTGVPDVINNAITAQYHVVRSNDDRVFLLPNAE